MFKVFWVCLAAKYICRADRTLDSPAVLSGIGMFASIRTQKYLIFLAVVNYV